jgi:hypothetical protein
MRDKAMTRTAIMKLPAWKRRRFPYKPRPGAVEVQPVNWLDHLQDVLSGLKVKADNYR